jgi:hypothetical protein
VETLPTTVVFRAGKVAPTGVVQGLTRKELQNIEVMKLSSSVFHKTSSEY